MMMMRLDKYMDNELGNKADCLLNPWNLMMMMNDDDHKFLDTIQYDNVYLTCSKKLTCSH